MPFPTQAELHRLRTHIRLTMQRAGESLCDGHTDAASADVCQAKEDASLIQRAAVLKAAMHDLAFAIRDQITTREDGSNVDQDARDRRERQHRQDLERFSDVAEHIGVLTRSDEDFDSRREEHIKRACQTMLAWAKQNSPIDIGIVATRNLAAKAIRFYSSGQSRRQALRHLDAFIDEAVRLAASSSSSY